MTAQERDQQNNQRETDNVFSWYSWRRGTENSELLQSTDLMHVVEQPLSMSGKTLGNHSSGDFRRPLSENSFYSHGWKWELRYLFRTALCPIHITSQKRALSREEYVRDSDVSFPFLDQRLASSPQKCADQSIQWEDMRELTCEICRGIEDFHVWIFREIIDLRWCEFSGKDEGCLSFEPFTWLWAFHLREREAAGNLFLHAVIMTSWVEAIAFRYLNVHARAAMISRNDDGNWDMGRNSTGDTVLRIIALLHRIANPLRSVTSQLRNYLHWEERKRGQNNETEWEESLIISTDNGQKSQGKIRPSPEDLGTRGWFLPGHPHISAEKFDAPFWTVGQSIIFSNPAIKWHCNVDITC
jgi:hypothetical protein